MYINLLFLFAMDNASFSIIYVDWGNWMLRANPLLNYIMPFISGCSGKNALTFLYI